MDAFGRKLMVETPHKMCQHDWKKLYYQFVNVITTNPQKIIPAEECTI
jgi:hypothetical protein